MNHEMQALPGQSFSIEATVRSTPGAVIATGSVSMAVPFEHIKDVLSDKPLRRPRRAAKRLSNEQLKRIALKNPPPAEWLEGEEQRPF